MIRRLCCTGALVVTVFAMSVPTAHAATVSPGKWAPKFCTALSDWQQTINDKGDEMNSELASVSGLEAARSQIVAFLGDMVDATDDMIDAIKAAGTPSSPNGAKISTTFVNGFKAISKEFAQAQDEAKRLPTTSAAEFKTAGTALGQALSDSGDRLGAGFDAVDKLDKGQKIEKAVTAAPACAFLSS